ncbi:MAG: hypothetical protein Q3980_09640 [Turicibacter sp.]|nr:hypothetical protein [Turicibacter sp.]
MAVYFARIEEMNNYYNLCPIFEVIGDEFIMAEIKSEFPTTGMITITVDSNSYFGEISLSEFGFYDIDKTELYLQKSVEEVGEGRKYNCYRVYETKLKKMKIESDQYPIYETFQIPSFLSIEKLKETRELKLEGYNLKPLSKHIYLKDTEKLYGPFEWKKKDSTSLLISSCNSSEYNYFIKSYLLDDLSDVIYKFDASEFEKSDNYGIEREVIFCDKFDYDYEEIDFINIKVLKDEVAKAINLTNSNYDLNELKQIIRSTSLLNLTNDRKQKILTMFENSEALQELSTEVASRAVNDSDNMKKIIDEILSNPKSRAKVINQIKGNEEVFATLIDTNEVSKKRKELNDLELEIQYLKEKKQELESESQINTIYDELEELEDEKNKLSKEVEEIRQRLALGKELADLNEQIEEARRNMSQYSKINNDIEDEIKSKVASAYVDVAFNGTIANEVLKAAASFEKQDQLNQYKLRVAKKPQISNVKDEFNTASELIEYLHGLINNKGKRKMSKNEIVNILLCITQGFLTVFAGEPGTGKTSLCALLSNCLGLHREDRYNRYVEVSVEKGWTSKRDFIGYYNPLTKLFDKANGQLFDAFNILNIEAEKKINDFPYFILLDEANLSPIEHYWADFMNVCDMSKSYRQINLSEDYQLSIPKSLRFLATINYDHTTEVFSPRLLDRSWVILLKSSELDINNLIDVPEMETQPIITYHELDRFFGIEYEQSLDESVADKFNEINKYLKENQLYLSPRVIIMIKNYCIAGEKLFDKSENRYVALDYAIAQKVMPMINGFGDTYKEFLESLQLLCDKADMPLCNKILQEIIIKGDNNMQYYQFFAK